jgi:hypothetical protein
MESCLQFGGKKEIKNAVFGLRRHASIVRNEVKEEFVTSMSRVERIHELGRFVVINTRRHIPEDGILHSYYLKTSNLTYC